MDAIESKKKESLTQRIFLQEVNCETIIPSQLERSSNRQFNVGALVRLSTTTRGILGLNFTIELADLRLVSMPWVLEKVPR